VRQDPQSLYTGRVDRYVSFVSTFSHQQGISALLLAENLVRDEMRVLDAGCGTGFATFALLDALRNRGCTAAKVDAFDLTPAMLDRFSETLRARGIATVDVRAGDVRDLAALPASWTGYDLIVSVSMLEYVPPRDLPSALRGLRDRLAPGGRMVIVITRRNPLTWLLIEKGWHAYRYTRRELTDALARAGLDEARFSRYPRRYFWLSLSNHVVIASPPRNS
jgi:SAM-dependent methyltransferase